MEPKVELKNNLGIAMFTVRQSAERDLSGTLQNLAALGYTGIEFYGAPVWPPQEIRTALQNSGMVITGYHTEYRDLQKNTRQKTAEFLNEIGCPLAVVPCLGGRWHVGHTEAEENFATWQKHIAWLQETEEFLKTCGIRTGYHNHEHEFLLQYGGKTVFDLIFESLPTLVMELDSGACIEGGGDPNAVLQKYRDRPKILHMKPFSKTRGFDVSLGDADDENDWASYFSPENRFEWLLAESENKILSEAENAQRCIAGARCFLKGE